jgi:hypothetical protein
MIYGHDLLWYIPVLSVDTQMDNKTMTQVPYRTYYILSIDKKVITTTFN